MNAKQILKLKKQTTQIKKTTIRLQLNEKVNVTFQAFITARH